MPAPKIETIIGSTTVSANAVAIAASKALPPRASISTPAAEASGWFDATTASEATSSRFRASKGDPARARQSPIAAPPATAQGTLLPDRPQEHHYVNKTRRRAIHKRRQKARN